MANIFKPKEPRKIWHLPYIFNCCKCGHELEANLDTVMVVRTFNGGPVGITKMSVGCLKCNTWNPFIVEKP